MNKAAQAHLAIVSHRHAAAVAAKSIDDRFESLERDDRIELLLTELKSRRALTP